MKHSVPVTVFLLLAGSADAAEIFPAHTSDDLNNPHTGFMLWGTSYSGSGAPANYYGATLFHVYVPWREVETRDQVFDWAGFEQRHLLPIVTDNPDATFVLRLVADYPNGPEAGLSYYYQGGDIHRDYPLFLEQSPLNIAAEDYLSCDGDGPGRTPDWNDPAMINQMQQLIAAYGAHFNGDPRITAVQAGLLGLWGEWHQTGCDSSGPGAGAKSAVRDAYKAAFPNTPVQLRYAGNPDAVGVEFGFHEDYFPSFTASCSYGFPWCDDTGFWNLEWAMTNLTPQSRDNWRSNPVSGESPLEEQQNTWLNDTADILTVLDAYHFSFLGPAGKHEQNGHQAVLNTIKRTLGYQFHVERAVWPDSVPLNGSAVSFALTLTLSNSGAAPLYHDDYRTVVFLLDGSQGIAWSANWSFPLPALLPGIELTRTGQLTASGIAPGSYSLRIAIASIHSGHKDILLQSAGRDGAGRVQLGMLQILPDTVRGSIFNNDFE